MTFQLEITKVVPPGDGFGVHNGKAVFVPATTTGDLARVATVKESKDVIFAAVEEILEPSPNRIEPPCPHYMECGGCSLMHLAYEDQLELKKRMLIETFAGHQIEIDPAIVPSLEIFQFRYRTQLNIREGLIGFSQRKGNQLVRPVHCKILSAGLMDAISRISQLQFADGECHLLESSAEGTVAGILMLGTEAVPVPGLPDSILEDYGSGKIELPVAAFAQSNPYITKKLVAVLLDLCRDTRQVVELYCGCGTFSIPVGARVEALTGIDSGDLAIQTARENAGRYHLQKLRFKIAILDRLSKLPKADTIIVDPPRKGMGKRVIKLIGKSKTSNLIYVSCNPATMVRDIATLINSYNFKLIHLKGYDMYCHSTHLETLAVLKR